jgi:DNA-binding MarR family transcriptional regulator
MTQTPQRLALALNDFLPYRLAVLAEQVSKVAAQIYADRFELTRPEWRVLAALAELGGISATEVSAHSTLDKMSVSRAVTSLESRDLLVRHDDDADRRNKIIDLTPKGRALYQKIVPLILSRGRLAKNFPADTPRAPE